MANHVFHPPADTVDQVISYVEGLVEHGADYGTIPMNGAKDLASIKAQAHALEPKAKEIHDLELKLALLQEQFNVAAVPLWHKWTEHMSYAKVYAEKNHKVSLTNFLRAFGQHHARATAAKAAQPPAPAK
jgi:hypothetical protein